MAVLNRPTGARELFLDCEWFISQRMYLLGYAYDLRHVGQLYGAALHRQAVASLFEGVEYVYFWGPDIGMIEKCFGLELRNQYKCINLLPLMKRLEPRRRSYSLANFERIAGVKRSTPEYKTNIFTLHRDWKDPRKRSRALLYNREDVVNMLLVKRFFFRKHGVRKAWIEEFRLK